MTKGEFIIGINYWPRRKAMYWWKEFDEDEVKEEFREIRDLKAKIVRFFLLWEDFQPKPDVVDQGSLAKLEIVLDYTHKYNLKAMPTLIVGHMSGVNWAPYWALSPIRNSPHPVISSSKITDLGIRDIYEDPDMLNAELLLVRTVVSRFSEHPAIFAWDISNEPGHFLTPKSAKAAKRWCSLIATEIRRVDPHHPLTLGLSGRSLKYDIGFHVNELSSILDIISIHGYLGTVPGADNPPDTDAIPFLNVLMEHLTKKPVLLQEFGVPSVPAEEIDIYDRRRGILSYEDAAQYYREVLEKLHRIGSLGVLVWCFSDYDKRLWDRPPLNKKIIERFFGLTRSDGELKPQGYAFRDFASKRKRRVLCPVELDINVEKYYMAPLDNLLIAFKHFKERIKRVL